MPNPVVQTLPLWNRLSRVPLGKWLFSRVLGWKIPYTGSIGAVIEELGPTRVRVRLRDRRAVRNHLRSVHAIALANLGELSTGLALHVGLPEGYRAILVSIRIEYRKKARGWLESDAKVRSIEASAEPRPHEVVAEILNSEGVVVAAAYAQWLVSRESR